ncbi:MAG: P1 family peptidase [Clostridiales bacterium]|nr:P1 family peptidase [Clostridiales bacterium]
MNQLFPGDVTRVHGIRVGQAQNEAARTGVTVVLPPREGAKAGVSVRGGAPGTRETDVLRPGNLVEVAHAVVLCGGSAFGLVAADGVMRFLSQSGIGVDMGVTQIPIVPAAVLFDLGVGDPAAAPDAAMGRAAATAAAKGVQQGRYGAGTGCTVGKLVQNAVPQPGGIGSASLTLPEGVTVGALVAVNAVGDVYHPHTGQCLACARMPDGTQVMADGLLFGASPMPAQMRIPAPGTNTTIGVVAVDCKLTKDEAARLADAAHGGLARAIRPSHTQMDGDTLFSLATGRVLQEVNFVKLCAAAQEVTARAVANAVFASRA